MEIVKVMLKKLYLCKAISVAKFSWNKRECLTSCEIAKSQQRIYKARSSSYTWAAYPCLYIQVFGDTYKRIRRAAHFL